MTFKEKWIQDHPGEEFKVGYARCPSSHGYSAKEDVSRCLPLSCAQCWDREMPEYVAFDDAIARMGREAVKSGKSLKAFSAAIKDSGDRTEFKTGAVLCGICVRVRVGAI